jgi:hypothetical protein
MPLLTHLSILITLLYRSVSAQNGETCGNCQSFGVDFISGCSYFQNSLSPEHFTA